MTRIGMLHTVPALADDFEGRVRAAGSDADVRHRVDESLLADAIATGVDDDVRERVARHVEALARDGVDAVLVTCSSIGEAVESAADRVDLPVLRVDVPMARLAVELGSRPGAQGRIAVLATLAATLGPTGRLLEREAAGRDIVVDAHLVEGAVEARQAGDQASHDRLIAEAAARLVDVDAIVLAQASMARALADADVSIPVLTSPDGGVAAVLDAAGATR